MQRTAVYFDPQRLTPPSRVAHGFDGLFLQPGKNLLAASDLTKLQAHPDLPRYRAAISFDRPLPSIPASEDQGEQDVPPSLPEDLADLSGLTEDEAKPVIAAADNLDVLWRWSDAEKRKGVGKLLNDRIDELDEGFSQ